MGENVNFLLRSGGGYGILFKYFTDGPLDGRRGAEFIA